MTNRKYKYIVAAVERPPVPAQAGGLVAEFRANTLAAVKQHADKQHNIDPWFRQATDLIVMLAAGPIPLPVVATFKLAQVDHFGSTWPEFVKQ